MGTWTGVLKQNEIYKTLFNLVISIDTFDRISVGKRLVDKARVDGSLYGDTKVYIGVDTLKVHDWGKDENGVLSQDGISGEAANLLATDWADDPKAQVIKLDVFKQIRLTTDELLSKRSFKGETSFGQFLSVLIGMLQKTKAIYDYTTYNAFIGTNETSVGEQQVTITIPANASNEDEIKLVAEGLANLQVKLSEVSRTYNDNQQTTIFSKDEINYITNSKWYNKFRKVDLPAIFHQDGLLDKLNDEVMAESYYGTVNASQTAGDGSTVRALEDLELTVSGSKVYIRAGELIPSGVNAPAGKSYTVDSSILAKVCVKLPPYMSAFELGTSFPNPRSHTLNRYLTIGRNTLEHLKAYPFITIRVVREQAQAEEASESDGE